MHLIISIQHLHHSHDAAAPEQLGEGEYLDDGDGDDEDHLEDLINHVDFGVREDLAADFLLN